MRDWPAERLAEAAGAELVLAACRAPHRATIDSRAVHPGELFVGIPGARVDGGAFAPRALEAGAWGALVTPERAAEAAAATDQGALLAAADPTAALGRLARAWRRDLGCHVIGITGSTGKTTTKDIVAALIGPHRRTVATPQNLNTEIGLPLVVLGASRETDVLVLELAMRGEGQIAELAEICEPDVSVIVNIGPVHLELLGSMEAIAAAKAEIIAGLAPGATAIIPAGEPLLDPHAREDVRMVTFGEGGDVRLTGRDGERVTIDAHGEEIALELTYTQEHNVQNTLAGVAAALAIGVRPQGRVEAAFSGMRGDLLELPDDVVVVNDCYNANPMSMRAALDELARTARGRRVAVLGDMLELGPEELAFHEEIGRHAAASGVDVLVTVGERAARMADAFDAESYVVADAGEAAGLVPELIQPGDTILVKASRGVGLELVSEALAEGVA